MNGSNFWDERYAAQQHVYGTEPNDFLRTSHSAIPAGPVLSLGEGEGRNAVFLATKGHEVTAVDSSSVGLRKAAALAAQRGVSLTTVHADLQHYHLGEARWSGIVSVFVPLPSDLRRSVYRRAVRALAPGGAFVLESYTPAQIGNGTGGGKDPDTMVTANVLRLELDGLTFEYLEELERDVFEGVFHIGRSAVVQLIARKP
ncbi:MAG: class I SAM-dependent methyltransferase [Myxococcota bacterium]